MTIPADRKGQVSDWVYARTLMIDMDQITEPCTINSRYAMMSQRFVTCILF
jgi:hypothetical protein